MQTNGSGIDKIGAAGIDTMSRFIAQNVVYVREVAAAELRGDGLIPVEAKLSPMQKFFALCTADGRRLAVLDNRDLAFAAARQHELEPVSVH